MIEVLSLTAAAAVQYSQGLQELEGLSHYPFGTDRFTIQHGRSYTAFFERLGVPLFHVALDGSKIVACAAGVLRNLPGPRGPKKAWYLCDLKVHPEYQKQRIPNLLFKKDIFSNYFRCGHGYAISMNPADRPNRVVKILSQLSYFPVSLQSQLEIFSLSFDEVRGLAPQLRETLGPIGFLSLEGKKDLRMESTGQRLELVHIQHGPMAEVQKLDPSPGAIHMICATPESRLGNLLKRSFHPSASASILGHRVKQVSWDFILTSDI